MDHRLPKVRRRLGTMRTGSATGGSPMRYCASLGHLHDDESGLVYMRARYYEPGSGRFISEDENRQASNWYLYCGNIPILRVDETGKDFYELLAGVAILGILFGGFKEIFVECQDGKGPLNPGRIIEKAVQSGLLAEVGTILGATWVDTVKGGLAAARTNAQCALVTAYAVVYAITIAFLLAFIDSDFDDLADQYLPR